VTGVEAAGGGARRVEQQPLPRLGSAAAELDDGALRRQPPGPHLLRHPERQHRRVELLRGGVAEQPPHRPVAQRQQQRLQLPTGFGEPVLDEAAAAVRGSGDDPGPLEAPQPLGEQRPGHPRQAPVQVVEAAAGAHQVADDEQVPPLGDDLRGHLDRAVLREHATSVPGPVARRQVRCVPVACHRARLAACTPS